MANILLTGAGGLLGRQSMQALAARHRVFAIDIWPFSPEAAQLDENPTLLSFDLRDYAAVYETFARYRIDYVVHAAAISHPGPSFAQPVTSVQVNFNATVTLLEAARLFGTKRFVFISSIGVYGAYNEPMVDEGHRMAGNSPYGVTKIAAELMGRMYATEFKVPFVALRYSHIYGPSRRLACPIKMLAEAAVRGDALHLPSGMDTLLQLIYQADVADPIIRCIEKQPHFHEYNIGDGAAYRLRDVADLLKMRFPKWEVDIGPGPLPRELTGLPPAKGAEATIDISRAARDLEFRPRYGLSDALQDYADHLLKRWS